MHAAPVIRRGMLLTSSYGSPPAGGHDYGRFLGVGWPVWDWRKDKYATCKGYRDAVDTWQKVKKEAVSRYGKRPGWFKGEGDYVDRLNSIEVKGKEAWKVCKSAKKGSEKGWTSIDTGAFTAAASGFLDPSGGIPADAAMAEYDSSTGGGGAPWGLLAGVGLLAVAVGGVIVWRKRQTRA
jgi:LPXTG-motif cell wall-anchored protein